MIGGRRKFVAIEQEEEYCLLALKRLANAELDASTQGFADGVFWERNSLAAQPQIRQTVIISDGIMRSAL